MIIKFSNAVNLLRESKILCESKFAKRIPKACFFAANGFSGDHVPWNDLFSPCKRFEIICIAQRIQEGDHIRSFAYQFVCTDSFQILMKTFLICQGFDISIFAA